MTIVLLFLAHILFVNLMVGGSILTLAYELRGRRRPELDLLAQKIAGTVTVNKSLAVVLGVGPLLVMNALYALWFYTANGLTGRAWIMTVPLVISAFLLLYAHKYSWQCWPTARGSTSPSARPERRCCCAVPLIFLANINLMLFPDRWLEVQGFLSTRAAAQRLPALLPLRPRLGGGDCALPRRVVVPPRVSISRPPCRVSTAARPAASCSTAAFGATALQLVAGPLVLMTLPPNGFSWLLLGNLTLA